MRRPAAALHAAPRPLEEVQQASLGHPATEAVKESTDVQPRPTRPAISTAPPCADPPTEGPAGGPASGLGAEAFWAFAVSALRLAARPKGRHPEPALQKACSGARLVLGGWAPAEPLEAVRAVAATQRWAQAKVAGLAEAISCHRAAVDGVESCGPRSAGKLTVREIGTLLCEFADRRQAPVQSARQDTGLQNYEAGPRPPGARPAHRRRRKGPDTPAAAGEPPGRRPTHRRDDAAEKRQTAAPCRARAADAEAKAGPGRPPKAAVADAKARAQAKAQAGGPPKAKAAKAGRPPKAKADGGKKAGRKACEDEPDERAAPEEPCSPLQCRGKAPEELRSPAQRHGKASEEPHTPGRRGCKASGEPHSPEQHRGKGAKRGKSPAKADVETEQEARPGRPRRGPLAKKPAESGEEARAAKRRRGAEGEDTAAAGTGQVGSADTTSPGECCCICGRAGLSGNGLRSCESCTASLSEDRGLKFVSGQRVWCRGFGPIWPAQIEMISFSDKEDGEPYCVKFFGDRRAAWVSEAKLVEWSERSPAKPQMLPQRYRRLMAKALEEAEVVDGIARGLLGQEMGGA